MLWSPLAKERIIDGLYIFWILIHLLKHLALVLYAWLSWDSSNSTFSYIFWETIGYFTISVVMKATGGSVVSRMVACNFI